VDAIIEARQMQSDFTFKAKVMMLQRNMTVTELARQIGRPRQTTSVVLNDSKNFPGIRRQIERALFKSKHRS
jgi:hypothetical protein